MELNLLYLEMLLITQCLCASLILDGVTKFVRKNEQVTFKCTIKEQETVYSWYVGRQSIESPDWKPLENTDFKATVHSNEFNYILNITIISNSEVNILCNSTTMAIKFKAIPLFNDNGNLYPSDETPNAIKDKKFILKCTTDAGSPTTWYTGNGTVIAKYIGTINQNIPKYFGSRQETSCQTKICTLSIITVSLDEDSINIICSSNAHRSLFNITVFVLPKSVTIKAASDTLPVEKRNKSYECLIEDINPEFSVFWQLTKKDGTKKNASYYISNSPSKSGRLINLSSTLTLKLNKNFKELQCVAYIPGKIELVKYSEKLNMLIKSSLTLNGGTTFVRENEQVTFECPIQEQEAVYSWYVGRQSIESPDWKPLENTDFKATVHSKEFNYILNITIISNSEVNILCNSTTMAMKFKAIPLFKTTETTETPLGIIISCTVAIVILFIILGLLAYKCHQIRGIKHNKDFSSTKDGEEPYAEVSDPKYVSMKLPDVDNIYVKMNKPSKVSKKHDDGEEPYAEVSDPKYVPMKLPDVDNIYVKMNKPSKVSKKHDGTNGSSPSDIYENKKQENIPDYISMQNLRNNAGNSKTKYELMEEEAIYADISFKL